MRLFERFKFRLADRLSVWSIRLRGQKVYETHCYVCGNRAAELSDKVWAYTVFLDSRSGGQNNDLTEEINDSLQRLAQLAGATWVQGIKPTDLPNYQSE